MEGSCLHFLILCHKKTVIASCPYIESGRHNSHEGWSSDFSPPQGAFSSKWTMALFPRAITEFTAAGQSGILTQILTKTFPIKRG